MDLGFCGEQIRGGWCWTAPPASAQDLHQALADAPMIRTKPAPGQLPTPPRPTGVDGISDQQVELEGELPQALPGWTPNCSCTTSRWSTRTA